MTAAERERFDRLVDQVLESLPAAIIELFDEKPLVIEDRPSPEILREFGLDAEQSDEICGLHSGPMGQVQHLDAASEGNPIDEIGGIHLFREGTIACAGGWEPWEERDEDGQWLHGGGDDLVEEEIRVTILHELGHHFGLDEDDLTALGYD